MGWVNKLKNSALKYLGKHGMSLARKAGMALMPRLSKKVNGFYQKNKHIIDPLVGTVKNLSDVAGDVASADVEGVIRSGSKVYRSGSQLVKGIRQGRGAPGNRGRKRKSASDNTGEPSGGGGGGKQPRLSGESLSRLTKLARV